MQMVIGCGRGTARLAMMHIKTNIIGLHFLSVYFLPISSCSMADSPPEPKGCAQHPPAARQHKTARIAACYPPSLSSYASSHVDPDESITNAAAAVKRRPRENNSDNVETRYPLKQPQKSTRITLIPTQEARSRSPATDPDPRETSTTCPSPHPIPPHPQLSVQVTPPRHQKKWAVSVEESTQDLLETADNLGAGLSQEDILAAQDPRRKQLQALQPEHQDLLENSEQILLMLNCGWDISKPVLLQSTVRMTMQNENISWKGLESASDDLLKLIMLDEVINTLVSLKDTEICQFAQTFTSRLEFKRCDTSIEVTSPITTLRSWGDKLLEKLPLTPQSVNRFSGPLGTA